MNQPIQPQQPAPPGPLPPVPQFVAPPKQKRPKRFGWLALILTAVITAVITAVASSGDGSTTTAPAPTVTVTETADPPPVVEGGQDDPTEQPTKAPAKFSPKTSDFQVSLKITSKQCFGSAGCIIDFEPKLAYKGTKSDLPDVGLTSVTYQVSGGEDEFTDTLTVDGDGSVTGAGEQTVDTAGPSRKLVAKVTGVEYNEFG